GRFLRVDPLGALNPYVYCGNDPLNFVDPWGLTGLSVTDINIRGYGFAGKSRPIPVEGITVTARRGWAYDYIDSDVTIIYVNNPWYGPGQFPSGGGYWDHKGGGSGGGHGWGDGGGGNNNSSQEETVITRVVPEVVFEDGGGFDMGALEQTMRAIIPNPQLSSILSILLPVGGNHISAIIGLTTGPEEIRGAVFASSTVLGKGLVALGFSSLGGPIAMVVTGLVYTAPCAFASFETAKPVYQYYKEQNNDW
ncbi:hypothetical protein KAW48_09825, partial [candidate division WOR-3 bacterium]|nr:hypothetical protein [candidate division WOR-3 bacterium]